MRRDLLGQREVGDLAVDGVGQERVQRALQPEQEADGPGRDLAASSATPSALACVEQLELAAAAVAAGLHAARTTAAGPTPRPCARKSANSASTSAKSDTTWSTPVPVAPMARAMPDQLVGLGGEGRAWARRWLRAVVAACATCVKPRAPASTASRGQLAPSAAMSLGRGRLPAARRARPSRAGAARRAGTWVATSTSNGRPSSASRNSGNDCHVPRQALVQRGAGDVLDALHQLDEPVVVGRAHRREADAAVAGHDGGDAVPRRRDQPRRPRWPGRRSGRGCRRSPGVTSRPSASIVAGRRRRRPGRPR